MKTSVDETGSWSLPIVLGQSCSLCRWRDRRNEAYRQDDDASHVCRCNMPPDHMDMRLFHAWVAGIVVDVDMVNIAAGRRKIIE